MPLLLLLLLLLPLLPLPLPPPPPPLLLLRAGGVEVPTLAQLRHGTRPESGAAHTMR
jgi:hypothetical protein